MHMITKHPILVMLSSVDTKVRHSPYISLSYSLLSILTRAGAALFLR